MCCGGKVPVKSLVRCIILVDIMVALTFTIYRVTSLALMLKRIVGQEKGSLSDPEFTGDTPESLSIKKYSTVFLITASVIGLAIEIFLFFLLNNGVRSENYKHCKHWFIIRLLLLTLSILGSLIEVVRGQYTWVNGVLEVEKLYRFIALLVVRSFMIELYKGMTGTNFDCNSGGDGYPNCNNSHIRSRSQSNF